MNRRFVKGYGEGYGDTPILGHRTSNDQDGRNQTSPLQQRLSPNASAATFATLLSATRREGQRHVDNSNPDTELDRGIR